MADLGKIEIMVTFRIVEEVEAALLVEQRHPVWTWCASGPHNWVEDGFKRTDALAYLVPEQPLNLPPDAEEYLPDADTDESEEPGEPDPAPSVPAGKPQPFVPLGFPPDTPRLLARGLLMIPDPDPGADPPFGIEPGHYDREGVVGLLRFHKGDPHAIQYIADMLA